MNERILCLDSGIGGLAYLSYLRRANQSAENCRNRAGRLGRSAKSLPKSLEWVYLADNAYFPFGEKNEAELRERICRVVAHALERYPARFVLLLCNTATVLALEELRKRLPEQHFIGTVPAIKPAAQSSKRRKIVMLASQSTSRAAYVDALHRRFAPDCELVAINAARLIRFIEEDWPKLLLQAEPKEQQENRSLQNALPDALHDALAPFVSQVWESGADRLVLGCTHFLHLKDELQNQLQAVDPEIELCDSLLGVGERLRHLLSQHCEQGAAGPQAKGGLLLLSAEEPCGPAEQRWRFWAARCGLRLENLDNGTF